MHNFSSFKSWTVNFDPLVCILFKPFSICFKGTTEQHRNNGKSLPIFITASFKLAPKCYRVIRYFQMKISTISVISAHHLTHWNGIIYKIFQISTIWYSIIIHIKYVRFTLKVTLSLSSSSSQCIKCAPTWIKRVKRILLFYCMLDWWVSQLWLLYKYFNLVFRFWCAFPPSVF